jgi:hypothetical protein
MSNEHFSLLKTEFTGKNGEIYSEVELETNFIPEMKTLYSFDDFSKFKLPTTEISGFAEPVLRDDAVLEIMNRLDGLIYNFMIKLSTKN